MVVTGSILFMFSFECTVRVIGYRMSLLNGTRMLDSFDVFIVVLSCVVYVVTLVLETNKLAKLVTFARVIRVLRVLKFARRLRKWVSFNKRRYKKDGFDLDLTYITPSVIAMSLPATGSEANYRNPIEDVVRFFRTYHDHQFLIFNLCAERSYDAEIFNGAVERILVADHNPPLFSLLIKFISCAESFMDNSPHNVLAVHCKSGKGRTGVFVCAWLRYTGFKSCSAESMAYFAARRTGKGAKHEQGVGGASQRRYLAYLDKAITHGGYRANTLRLLKVRMYTCPHMDIDGGCDPWITIEQSPGADHNKNIVFSSDEVHGHQIGVEKMRKDEAMREFDVDIDVAGDIRVVLYDRDLATDELTCFVWFHTGFIQETNTVFTKDQIDIAWADKKCKVFRGDFKLEFEFATVPSEQQIFGSANKLSLVRDGNYRLGTWCPIPTPSARTVERTMRYLGGGYVDGATIKGQSFTVKIEGDLEEDQNSLEQCQDNLCVAPGPAVEHNNVHLISLNASVLHSQSVNTSSNEQEKKLIQYYKHHSSEDAKKKMAISSKVRALVSLNKKRFQEDGFDLDLTYITPRIIAMGYPAAKGIEGQYRNSADDVYRFFQV